MAKKRTGKVGQTSSQKGGGTSASIAGATASHVSVLADDAIPKDDAPDGLNTIGESKGGHEVEFIANDKCYLLNMTSEIRQKIWTYTIKEDKIIAPKQIQARSNKFVPSLVERSPTIGEAVGKVYPEPMPSAAQMSLVCHQLYDEITGSCLFYRVNEFVFNDFDQMLAYLVAITSNRANSIRSVNVIMPSWGKNVKAVHAFNMLASCQGLRKLMLRILIDYTWSFHLHYKDLIPGYNGLKNVRGLDSITFQCGLLSEHPKWSHLQLDMDPELAYRKIEGLRHEIEASVTQPRVAIPVKKIKAAEEVSGLNIYGEGRLGPDKKPGIVASRTRAQLANQRAFNDNGVCPDVKEVPKFGEFGDLLWDIVDVSDSRELSGGEGKSSVEVFITWSNGSPQSWELLDSVINPRNVFRVTRHYMRNPEAYDLSVFITTINELVEKCPEKSTVLKDLTLLVNRNESFDHAFDFRRLCNSYKYRSA